MAELETTAILPSDVRSGSYFTGIRVSVCSVDFRGVLVQNYISLPMLAEGKCHTRCSWWLQNLPRLFRGAPSMTLWNLVNHIFATHIWGSGTYVFFKTPRESTELTQRRMPVKYEHERTSGSKVRALGRCYQPSTQSRLFCYH